MEIVSSSGVGPKGEALLLTVMTSGAVTGVSLPPIPISRFCQPGHGGGAGKPTLTPDGVEGVPSLSDVGAPASEASSVTLADCPAMIEMGCRCLIDTATGSGVTSNVTLTGCGLRCGN